MPLFSSSSSKSKSHGSSLSSGSRASGSGSGTSSSSRKKTFFDDDRKRAGMYTNMSDYHYDKLRGNQQVRPKQSEATKEWSRKWEADRDDKYARRQMFRSSAADINPWKERSKYHEGELRKWEHMEKRDSLQPRYKK